MSYRIRETRDTYRFRYITIELISSPCVPKVLQSIFQQVFIPPQVASEMGHAKAPTEVRNFITNPPSWLLVRSPTVVHTFPHLDRGEEAAISLAIELNAVLLIDEHDGRVVAQNHGLSIVGAIGVLELAANMRLIRDLASIYGNLHSMRFTLRMLF